MRNRSEARVAPGAPYPRLAHYVGLATLVFAVQFLLVAKSFPLSEVWSDRPLFHIDNALHWYLMKLGANLAATGNVVGYDPFFAAGHINGLNYNLSARIPTLLAALFSPGVDEIRLYKAYVFGAAVIAPLAVFGAAMALRLTPIEALIAAILGISMWWVSYLRWYYTAGMVGYVTVCYAAVLFSALVIRYLEGDGNRWVPVGLGLFGACGFFLHWALPVPVAIAVLAYLLIHAARLNWPRALSALTIIGALSLLPNLAWLYISYRYGEPTVVPEAIQSTVDASQIGRELLGKLGDKAQGSKIYPLLFIATVVACSLPRPQNGRRVWLALLLGAAGLQVLAFLGAAVPSIAYIQPNRFAPAGYLLLCIPAARGLNSMSQLVLERGAAIPRRIVAGAGVAAMFLVVTILTWEVWREVTPGPQGRYGAAPPEVRPLGENSVWLISWLKRRTTADMRILFETSFARIHDQAHMAGYYAYSTEREFIGGAYPKQLFASAWDGFAFGKPIAQISTSRMTEYLNVYNIGAIVVHSEAAKNYFNAMPGVRLDSEHGILRAYLVAGDHSYFLRGGGHVQERGHNHVLITDIKGPELVLKYHYVPGLVTDPPTLIQGIRLLDDPKPFVRIVDPPPRLRLYMP